MFCIYAVPGDLAKAGERREHRASGSEAASAPSPSASTETEESESPSEEPSKAVLPSEQPIETTEKPDPAEDKKDIEPEVLEIPETIIGKYLIPIDDGAYEALLAAQPKLGKEELEEELKKYVHTIANADGTFTKQIYFEPVRYQDTSGVWQDIVMKVLRRR